jgi:uridine kinase
MNIDRLNSQIEFEQKYIEREHKFVANNPESFALFAELPGEIIHQVYLSSPNDEFSLRMRRTETDEHVEYTATLKSRGELSDDRTDRTEIETPISEEAYLYHLQINSRAELHKKRVHVADGITIDYIEGYDRPLIEAEEPDVDMTFIDIIRPNLQAAPLLTNEQIAFEINNAEIPEITSLDIDMIVDELVAHLRCGKQQVVLGLSGMSGSGKTTALCEINQTLRERYPDLPLPVVLSTDDYHFGKSHLETTHGQPCTNWDDACVYDTERLARDITALKNGETVPAYRFNFTTEEPEIIGEIAPSPFILVEGIHAGSPDLQDIRDVFVEVPTTPATAIGRDVMRLVGRSNGSIASPEARLRYDLETALPTYQKLERPSRMSNFSASSRPLDDAALRWLIKQ